MKAIQQFLSDAVRSTLILLGASAWYGMAVLGLGGFEPLISDPALIALTIAMAVLTGVSLFAGANLSPGVREDRDNRWVLPVFALIGLLAGFLPACTDRNEFWTLDGETLRWIGVLLYSAGGALRIWPVFVLGDRFSGLVAIQPGHMLVGLVCIHRLPNRERLRQTHTNLGTDRIQDRSGQSHAPNCETSCRFFSVTNRSHGKNDACVLDLVPADRGFAQSLVGDRDTTWAGPRDIS